MDFNSNIPIYQQIMDEMKRRIITGQLMPGDKLSSVRELAAEMGVNPNTVQKALSLLEQNGLLYAERTSGRYVAKDEKLIQSMKEEVVMEKLNEFIAEMGKIGYSINEIAALVNEYADKKEGSHG